MQDILSLGHNFDLVYDFCDWKVDNIDPDDVEQYLQFRKMLNSNKHPYDNIPLLYRSFIIDDYKDRIRVKKGLPTESVLVRDIVNNPFAKCLDKLSGEHFIYCLDLACIMYGEVGEQFVCQNGISHIPIIYKKGGMTLQDIYKLINIFDMMGDRIIVDYPNVCVLYKYAKAGFIFSMRAYNSPEECLLDRPNDNHRAIVTRDKFYYTRSFMYTRENAEIFYRGRIHHTELLEDIRFAMDNVFVYHDFCEENIFNFGSQSIGLKTDRDFMLVIDREVRRIYLSTRSYPNLDLPWLTSDGHLLKDTECGMLSYARQYEVWYKYIKANDVGNKPITVV